MPLTPEEFNKLATKNDLKVFQEELKGEFASKKQADEIIGLLDGIAKELKDHKQDHDMNQAAHDRFEKRITTLEGKTAVV